MQSGQLGIRLARHAFRCVVPTLLVSLLQHPASAQTEVRAGVSVYVVEEPYTIRGATAQDLLTQMRTLGSGGSFASFRLSPFRWSYSREDVQNVRGVNSGRCRISNFGVRFDITAIYPVWDRPLNAPSDLVEAWEAFEDLMARQREERRDGIEEFGADMRRQARRVEEACTFLGGRVEEVVDRVRGERAEAQREAAANGELIRLQWPPPGFSPRD